MIIQFKHKSIYGAVVYINNGVPENVPKDIDLSKERQYLVTVSDINKPLIIKSLTEGSK